jgi:dihydropteroate synthase
LFQQANITMPDSFDLIPVKKTINCKGKLIDLSQGRIMGILNVTPDSFFDGGKFNESDSQLSQVEKMLHAGADFIDIGGFSTRPGADEVSEDDELKRVIPIIESISNKFPEAIISIDSFRAKVAEEAIKTGAAIINDVTAGEGDPDMFATVARLQVPYIIMHKQGTFKDMQAEPHYENVVKEVIQYLSFKIEKLTELGVHDIIVDPGFGFGKTLEHNFQLLKHLDLLRILGKPILAGVSRKSMINKLLKTKPENALTGTIAVNSLARLAGADILRVHDVKEAVETLKVINFYRETV